MQTKKKTMIHCSIFLSCLCKTNINTYFKKLITLSCCHQALTALAELPLPVHASPHFHLNHSLQINEANLNVNYHDQCVYNNNLVWGCSSQIYKQQHYLLCFFSSLWDPHSFDIQQWKRRRKRQIGWEINRNALCYRLTELNRQSSVHSALSKMSMELHFSNVPKVNKKAFLGCCGSVGMTSSE